MSLSSLSSITDSSDEERIPRLIRISVHLFEKYDDFEFISRFRLSKSSVAAILRQIEPALTPATRRSKPVDAMNQLLITLRFYATGTFQEMSGDTMNIHKSTVCRIVQKVTNELVKFAPKYIKMPTITEFSQVAESFYELAGFPRVVGVVDGTHIKIISQGGVLSENFRCRKGFFSINVQLVCDANLKIRDIIARWPGSVPDSWIFNNSHLCADFERGIYGHYYLLGDSGYYCKRFLLTPFTQPGNPSEEAYNRSHILTRKTVERCIDVWKRRFHCIGKGMALQKIETILKIIVATAVLHNMAMELQETQPVSDLNLEFDSDDFIGGESENDFSVRTDLVTTVFATCD